MFEWARRAWAIVCDQRGQWGWGSWTTGAGEAASSVADEVGPGIDLSGFDKGGSLSDVASKIWGGVEEGGSDLAAFAKEAMPVAQVGLGVGSLVAQTGALSRSSELAKVARDATKQQLAAAQPATAYGQSQLSQSQAGQIPEAQRQTIENWKAGAKQQIHDQLARMGQGDSDTLKQWDAYIDKQAAEMVNQALQAESAEGLSALQIGAGAAGGAASAASSGAQSIDQLIAAANMQIGRVFGGAA